MSAEIAAFVVAQTRAGGVSDIDILGAAASLPPVLGAHLADQLGATEALVYVGRLSLQGIRGRQIWRTACRELNNFQTLRWIQKIVDHEVGHG